MAQPPSRRRKRLKKPADVRAALEAGRHGAETVDRAVSMGDRVIPEIRALATDATRIQAEDPAAALALAIVSAVGAPDDLVPALVEVVDEAPPDSEIQDELVEALTTGGDAALDGLLARIDAPGPLHGRARALARFDDPRVADALRILLDRDPLGAAPAIGARGKADLLPDLERHLSTLAVPARPRAEELGRFHAFATACHQLASQEPGVVMLQAAVAEGAQRLAAEMMGELQALHGLDEPD